ncbi:MAG: hypothetical protein LDL33_03790, partial [Desulfomonile sp.]|nr:hypothetical protein [Desulfomonile sp.]
MASLRHFQVGNRTLWVRLFGVIVERKWLFFAVWLSAVAVAIGYCVLTPPSYRSTAVVRIEPETPYAQIISVMFKSFQDLAGDEDDGEDEASLQSSTRSHTAIKKSIQRYVAADKATPAHSGTGALLSKPPSAKPVVSFAPAHSGPTDGSELVQLEATAGDPVAARQALISFLEEFKREHASEANARIDRLKTVLEKEMEDVKSQAEMSRRELIEFTTEHRLVLDSDRASPVAMELRQAANELVKSRRDRWDLETRTMNTGDGISRRGSDDLSRHLRSKLEAIQTEHDLPGEEGSGLSRVVLKRKIELMRQALRDRDAAPFESALREAWSKEKRAEEAYAQLKRDALKTNSAGLRFEILKQSAEGDRQLLFEIRRKLKELELYRGLRREAVIVESPPSLPSKPVHPQTTKIFIIGTLLGLVLGVGTATAASLSDKRVKAAEQIRR